MCTVLISGFLCMGGSSFYHRAPVVLCSSIFAFAITLTMLLLHTPLLYLRFVNSISVLGGSILLLNTMDDNMSACISNSSFCQVGSQSCRCVFCVESQCPTNLLCVGTFCQYMFDCILFKASDACVYFLHF